MKFVYEGGKESLLLGYQKKTPLKCKVALSNSLTHLTEETRICNPKGSCCCYYLGLLLCMCAPPLWRQNSKFLAPPPSVLLLQRKHYLKTLFLWIKCIN